MKITFSKDSNYINNFSHTIFSMHSNRPQRIWHSELLQLSKIEHGQKEILILEISGMDTETAIINIFKKIGVNRSM